MGSTEVTLPSGAKLKITLGSFKESKALYQSMLEEAKSLTIDPNAEVDVNLYKDLFCAGFASKKIESCLWECMKRVTYNDLKITEETFESAEAREDYMSVCFEVAKENIRPFMKALMQQFSQFSAILAKPLA